MPFNVRYIIIIYETRFSREDRVPVFFENTQDMKRVLNNFRIQMASILENIYLVLFGIIVLYLFLQKTTFEIPWELFTKTEDGTMREWCRWLLEPPYYLLGYVAVFRCILQKEYNWRKTACAVMILVSGKYIWEQNGNFKILLLTLVIVGAMGIPIQRMLREYFLIILIALTVTVSCAVLGVIENYTFMRGEHLRMFFGINSPTNFASFVLFQVLCWWYLRKNKLTYIEAGVVAAVSLFLYIFCHTRTACVLLFCVAICMAWLRFIRQWKENKGEQYQMNSVAASVLSLAHPLLAMLIIGLTIFFKVDSQLFIKLNAWLTDRLTLGKRAFDVYGVSWFGQYVPVYGFSDGQAVDNYFYIDSAYVQMPIMFGLAAMILLLAACLFISCRAWKTQDWVLLLILALIAIHCVTDPHLVELQFCPFLIALLANVNRQDGMCVKEIFGRIRWKEK